MAQQFHFKIYDNSQFLNMTTGDKQKKIQKSTVCNRKTETIPLSLFSQKNIIQQKKQKKTKKNTTAKQSNMWHLET